ncbi:MAG: hypothetical protein Q4B73_06735 [Lachnospiraceae bacterium]|nr:hypothetical protein [Lachnospiraceae bacterium]
MTTMEAMLKLNEDAALSAKVKAECKTAEEVYEVLKSVGLTDDFDAFKAAAVDMNVSMTKMDEKDVDAVVGGRSSDTITTVTTTTTASIAAAAAA